MYQLKAYQYDLPKELIAKYPSPERGTSRLMVINRESGGIEHRSFQDIHSYLDSGDQLVLNNTRVIPARLIGKKETGAQVEIFLVKERGEDRWEAMAKPGKKLRPGTSVVFGPDFSCQVEEELPNGQKLIRLLSDRPISEAIEEFGRIPLPHYMGREAEKGDSESYQTVYAKEKGAVAAPTAGLHFTEEILRQLAEKGVDIETLTLHVGLGTFKPVVEEDIRNHTMHEESYIISPATAASLNRPHRRQICVGTTTCRALEASAAANATILPGEYSTDIFIYPGYQFKYVRSLLTNFHLPGSSLLMLVSAFAGYDLIRNAYKEAIEKRYRFFSYGDAMLIL